MKRIEHVHNVLAPLGSRPAVGSSKTSTSGSIARTPAIATLRIWPPLSSNGERSKCLPEGPQAPAFLCFPFSVFFLHQNSSARMRCPSAQSLQTADVREIGKRFRLFSQSLKVFILLPVARIVLPSSSCPLVGFSNPFKCRRSVDLPDPVCPMTAT